MNHQYPTLQVPWQHLVCKNWINSKLRQTPALHTPTDLLYRAFLRDHPETHLEPSQIEKILKSTFYKNKRKRDYKMKISIYKDLTIKKHNQQVQITQDTPTPETSPNPPKSLTLDDYFREELNIMNDNTFKLKITNPEQSAYHELPRSQLKPKELNKNTQPTAPNNLSRKILVTTLENLKTLSNIIETNLTMGNAYLQTNRIAIEIEQAFCPHLKPPHPVSSELAPSRNTKTHIYFTCIPTPELKAIFQEMEDDQFESILQHHQKCTYINCITCKSLRSAMIHLTLHNHNCQIRLIIKNISIRHSRNCSLPNCPIDLGNDNQQTWKHPSKHASTLITRTLKLLAEIL